MPTYAPPFGTRPAPLAGALVAALHAARQDELAAWAFYRPQELFLSFI